jgi:hypothetical protein
MAKFAEKTVGKVVVKTIKATRRPLTNEIFTRLPLNVHSLLSGFPTSPDNVEG